MRLLGRYVALEFLRPFGFGMGLFLVLIFLGHVFDRATILSRSQASLGTILLYLWLEVPFYAVKIMPVATMLATLFAIGSLRRTGEWVAAQAAGYAPLQLARPLFACALLVAGLTFAAQETLLPWCTARANELYRDEIKRQPEKAGVWTNVVLIGRPGDFLTAAAFDARAGLMERVVLDEYRELDLARQLDARSATWDAGRGRWVFLDGVSRLYEPGKLLPSSETPFTSLESDLDTPPGVLVPQDVDPDEMSLVQTWRHIRRLTAVGSSARAAWVAFHEKIAFPFSNLIVCACGLWFGLAAGRTSRSLHFAGALGVAFVYWWFLSLGEALGQAGRLGPVAAAWLGNAVFGTLGVVGLRRLWR